MDSASPPAVEVTLSPLSSDDKGDSTSQQAECMICYEEPTTYGLLGKRFSYFLYRFRAR